MRKMKDSGIEWIGEIPEDWEVLPFRHVLQERNERNNPVVSEERLSLSIERGVTLYADKTTNLDRFKDDFAQYKLAYIGDLVMNSMNMIVGATGVSKWFGCVSPVYYTFYDNDIEHTTAKFCEYIFRSKTMLRVLHSFGKGIYSIDRGDDKINTCRLKVAKSDLKNIKIPIPQISEQKLIIQFLDKKCSEIDSVISKTRETIEEYKKLKQSIITEVVTGKVKIENEKVCGKYDTYKDSGIEWIGEIPSEWKITKIKHEGIARNGLTYTPTDVCDKEEGELVLRSSNIQNNKLILDDCVFVNTKINNELYVKENDILICSRNGSPKLIGKNALIPANLRASFGAFMLIYRCKIPFYIRLVLNSDIFSYYLGNFLTVSVNQLTIGNFNEIQFPLPPKQEQDKILMYLNRKCSEIDKLITKKEQLVVELEAYKKSLIYEVVTGKRSV